MQTIYLPIVGSAGATLTPSSHGFGIAIRSQCATPTAHVLKILNPPYYHNWTSYAYPGWQEPDGQHVLAAPGFVPALWNPPAAAAGTSPDAAPDLTAHCAANPGALWLIGNEPVRALPPHEFWMPPERMAACARAVGEQHGVRYALCGGIAYQDADYEYARALLRLGAAPAAWHWHIYVSEPDDWWQQLRRVLEFDPGRPVVISEAGVWGPRPFAAQCRVMEYILETLRRYPQVEAVFWYVSWDPDWPETSLLDGGGREPALTELGRHYCAM